MDLGIELIKRPNEPWHFCQGPLGRFISSPLVSSLSCCKHAQMNYVVKSVTVSNSKTLSKNENKNCINRLYGQRELAFLSIEFIQLQGECNDRARDENAVAM